MAKKTARQFMRHIAGGAPPFAVNFATYNLLVVFELAAGHQPLIAFLVGGQVAFWTHDRWSYRHRNPTIDGWFYRWLWFMPGQVGGGTLNWYVSNQLDEKTDIWQIFVYIAATIAGVAISFPWTNWLSHKDDDPSISPAEPARVCTRK